MLQRVISTYRIKFKKRGPIDFKLAFAEVFDTI